MRNNCHCNLFLNSFRNPPSKIKPLMLEERKTALERRDVRQKKWQWRMFLRQILVCCQCPNPKPLNNLHCHGSSSQWRLFITSFNHKLPSSTPNLLLLQLVLLCIYHYHYYYYLCFCSVGSPFTRSIYSCTVFQQIKQTQKLYCLQTAQTVNQER